LMKLITPFTPFIWLSWRINKSLLIYGFPM
jgi:hypothetical protein